jgi:hypothetical protein
MLHPELITSSFTGTISFSAHCFQILYGYETWSLRLSEEHTLRVTENRVLRRIFEPKRDEAKGKWRKLHSEELHDLYSPSSIIRVIKSRKMRWGGM